MFSIRAQPNYLGLSSSSRHAQWVFSCLTLLMGVIWIMSCEKSFHALHYSHSHATFVHLKLLLILSAKTGAVLGDIGMARLDRITFGRPSSAAASTAAPAWVKLELLMI